MKANELRIGNLLITDHAHKKLFTIIDSGNDPLCRLGNDISGKFKMYKEYFLSECAPIPLTEEWFKKFGFTKTFGNWDLDKDKVMFQFSNDKIFRIYPAMEGEIILDIKYVHQLQNLYFALTEEELTIKN